VRSRPSLLFVLRAVWRVRAAMRLYLHPDKQCRDVLDLEPRQLYAAGVRVLVLDFDGVLAPHNATTVTAEVTGWLERCVACFGRERVLILSNNPLPARITLFTSPLLPIFWQTRYYKPFPYSLRAIVSRTRCRKQQVLVIDDRLTSGVLAASLLGIPALWLACPRVAWRRYALAEIGFWCVRKLELLYIWLIAS
jgi:HAD superfamily phosphatase (TIGR01668 family)